MVRQCYAAHSCWVEIEKSRFDSSIVHQAERTTPSIDEKKITLSPGIVDANVQKNDMVYYGSKSRLNMGMYDNLLQMGSLIY